MHRIFGIFPILHLFFLLLISFLVIKDILFTRLSDDEVLRIAGKDTKPSPCLAVIHPQTAEVQTYIDPSLPIGQQLLLQAYLETMADDFLQSGHTLTQLPNPALGHAQAKGLEAAQNLAAELGNAPKLRKLLPILK